MPQKALVVQACCVGSHRPYTCISTTLAYFPYEFQWMTQDSRYVKQHSEETVLTLKALSLSGLTLAGSAFSTSPSPSSPSPSSSSSSFSPSEAGELTFCTGFIISLRFGGSCRVKTKCVQQLTSPCITNTNNQAHMKGCMGQKFPK